MRDGMPAPGRLLRRVAMAIGLLLLAAVPPRASSAGEPFYVTLATRALIIALAAVSLDLILGYGGMVSFGHAAFVGIGAYVVAILAQHAGDAAPMLVWPLPVPGTTSALLAWPAAMLGAGLCAALIGLVSLRTSGVYFIMITLAFAQMIYFFFVSLERYGGDDGISLYGRSELVPALDLGDQTVFYYVVLAILVGALFLCGRLVGARFGAVIQGTRENERRMRALGFPTLRYKLACFTISGALAGLAGALLANQTEFVSPAFLHWTRSGELIVMVILGGMGTLVGPVIGALIYLLLEEVLSSFTQHWMVVFGPLLVLIVLFAKGGVLGAFKPSRQPGG